jgi:cytochrome c biogenesis protein CcdA
LIDSLIARLAEGTVLAPLIAFGVGVLLSLSPVALPSLSVVVGSLAPRTVDATGRQRLRLLLAATPSVVAFVAGMDGALGLASYFVVEVTEALTRASVALHLVAAAVLAAAGARLLSRRTSLCQRAGTLPPTPGRAFVYGMLFAVGGCPACGPIVISLGAATALVAGPGYALVVLGAFVAGRAATLLATAGLGARLLPGGGGRLAWRRLDLVVGVLFVAAGAYYLFRVLNGDVTTSLPGEPGSGVLP